MPMPPSQWLSWRQNSIERGSSSILGTSVAPVAVKPESASKYASTGRESCGTEPSTNGSAPNAGTSSQIKATTRKLSRGTDGRPALLAGDLVEQQAGCAGGGARGQERPHRLARSRAPPRPGR